MKNLKFKKLQNSHHEDYEEDIQRIMLVCLQNDYLISQQDAMIAWEKYSEDYFCAGWLVLPKKDEEILSAVLKIMEEE